MKQLVYFIGFIVVLFFSSCSSSKKNYNPNQKFSSQALQQDFSLVRNILEKKHPALYWYTPKDSMNFYFDSLYNSIKDSMTELQFGWKILAPLTQKIHCGHTSFGMSKGWYKYIKDKRVPSFPLHVKLCGDTMVVSVNLNKKDSILNRGTIITSINGISSKDLIHQMFQYLPLDGYAENVNYVRLSSNFPFFHRNIFGLFSSYRVGYMDSVGNFKHTFLPMYIPERDSSKKEKISKLAQKKIKQQKIDALRVLQIDKQNSTATITLNTFTAGKKNHLRHFIKSSFKKIKNKKIKNCILDLRANGGGDVGMYILLTKYLRNTPFKVCDTATCSAKSLKPYGQYISQRLLSAVSLFFLTKKKHDGKYHFGLYERKWYNPKVNNHFNGKLFVLTNGPTFSASTLFCNAIKGQSNATLIGEETGGGWYGNNGLMIPDIKLPHTKMTVRLPLFKIIQFKHTTVKGTGVPPDIYVPPTKDAILNKVDTKMEMAKSIIKQIR